MSIVGKIYPFELSSEQACSELAQKISPVIQSITGTNQNFHIWFCGDLGSGKTTLIRYLLQSLGYHGKVKSPTYNLCEPYSISFLGNDIHIHHFDLYRMNHPLEWEEAGFKEILFQPGVNLIEWPEKAENTLPPADLVVHMEYVSDLTRKGFIEAQSKIGQQFLNSIA